ncbi:glycerol-3-phosphate 1-O-acyltransferase PlsY [Faecalicatena contorta]|uniref:glycerol-3-phosphate 1-O-acyltransferase PlsY n=1 Tax=Lachnospiraceae TaxID=186803 RepID=UPI001F4640D1|nr:glycerol-3-phosphate 1-O-acyltransferase PlsY [Faecalicatena contorta]MCF2667372.1 glycerol-3-phosphate 1-O-acyltransferase PlsY [Faecalicatena contorta]
MERLICVMIGYVFGLFQTGYIYGKMHNIDIRKQGSGNAGTTNALRTMGWKAGLVTFLGDCFKCVFAVVIVHLLYGKTHADMIPLLAMYAGMGAVLGHNYPFYLKFKGGKGIAATAGLLVSTTNVWMVLICLVAFVAIVGVTRYVSLGSLAVVIIYLVEVVVYGQMGGFGVAANYLCEMYAIVAFLMLSAFFKHRANIQRLLSGTENKLSVGKNK